MQRPKLFYGWWQVLIFAWILGVGSTTIQFSVGFLVDPIINEFGWSMLAVSTAFSLRSQSSAIAAPGVDREQLQALVDAAHIVCPYSNATRGNIDVTLELV